MNRSLSQMYDEIKSEINTGGSRPSTLMNVQSVGNLQHSPGALAWRNQAAREVEKLSDECCKRILVDIYCKIIPLDSSFVQGNQSMMRNDIDSFLANKGMSATQYLKSCREATRAPLLEFIIRSCENIGKQFMEEANKKLKDAQENNIDIPPPEADVEKEENQKQLVDITKDMEYEGPGGFIEKLKKKTIDSISSSIARIIKDTEAKENMKFNPNPGVETVTEMSRDKPDETPVSAVIEHIHEKMWKENIEITPELNEQIIGLAIREATLNQLDLCFKQPDSELIPFRSKIRFGKGALVTENAIKDIFFSKEQVRKESGDH